jgi:hypothetical protein
MRQLVRMRYGSHGATVFRENLAVINARAGAMSGPPLLCSTHEQHSENSAHTAGHERDQVFHRSSGLTLDKMALLDDPECFVTAVDAQLAVNGAEMVPHRARRDKERLGDLGVGQATLRETQYFDLAL